eukprot:GEMP01054502.1.p1 GENE.GEMP01054502.1~~GEMP01054502.1.p1  ORF type:complete len:214 (+),score=26.66 GEMP01054502.1:209-850(+)
MSVGGSSCNKTENDASGSGSPIVLQWSHHAGGLLPNYECLRRTLLELRALQRKGPQQERAFRQRFDVEGRYRCLRSYYAVRCNRLCPVERGTAAFDPPGSRKMHSVAPKPLHVYRPSSSAQSSRDGAVRAIAVPKNSALPLVAVGCDNGAISLVLGHKVIWRCKDLDSPTVPRLGFWRGHVCISEWHRASLVAVKSRQFRSGASLEHDEWREA